MSNRESKGLRDAIARGVGLAAFFVPSKIILPFIKVIACSNKVKNSNLHYHNVQLLKDHELHSPLVR